MSSPALVTTSRMRAVTAWAATLTASLAAIAVLHRLGGATGFAIDWNDLWGWVGTHSPERVLLGFARVAALGLSYWVCGSLVVSTLVQLLGLRTLIRTVDWLTLPAVRRVAERAVALSLTACTLAGGALAPALATEDGYDDAMTGQLETEAPAATTYVPVPAGDAAPPPAPAEVAPGEPVLAESAPIPAPGPGPSWPEVAPRRFDPAAADAPAVASLRIAHAEFRHDVVAGEHLWSIAEGHLQHVLGRRPGEAETATYWAHLIEANRGRLRSGNPDLIYPGETVMCPPTIEVGLGSPPADG